MRHLTRADYHAQPWKNGKGVTLELAREERAGALLWRLSMATVAEDGPFSLFAGIERNLTVLDGPGFRLEGGGVSLDCRPLQPVAFAGDIPLQAVGTGGVASTDFNVMTARALPRPQVWLERGGEIAAGGLVALFALGPAMAGGRELARHDLVLARGGLTVSGPLLAVRLAV